MAPARDARAPSPPSPSPHLTFTPTRTLTLIGCATDGAARGRTSRLAVFATAGSYDASLGYASSSEGNVGGSNRPLLEPGGVSRLATIKSVARRAARRSLEEEQVQGTPTAVSRAAVCDPSVIHVQCECRTTV